jgi:hypothetical protein
MKCMLCFLDRILLNAHKNALQSVHLNWRHTTCAVKTELLTISTLWMTHASLSRSSLVFSRLLNNISPFLSCGSHVQWSLAFRELRRSGFRPLVTTHFNTIVPKIRDATAWLASCLPPLSCYCSDHASSVKLCPSVGAADCLPALQAGTLLQSFRAFYFSQNCCILLNIWSFVCFLWLFYVSVTGIL